MKKVLVITYYWPPAGGIQVYRILKFVKFFRENGWEPIVYTAENPEYPFHDRSYFRDIPEGITVLKKNIFEPLTFFKKLSANKAATAGNNLFEIKDKKASLFEKLGFWIRANFFIPDARAKWISPSVSFLIDYLKVHPVDLIFTTAPPHSITVIGQKLKLKTGIPWISDWRDPWTQVDYFRKFPLTAKSLKKHHLLEQSSFDAADLITTVSESWKADLQRIGAKNTEVVYSGFDMDDFRNLEVEKPEKFTILHAGSLGKDRDPQPFLTTLIDLMDEENFARDLEVKFFGAVDYRIVEFVKNSRLADNVTFAGFQNKDKIVAELAASSLILIVLNQAENTKGRVPGKIYESLAVKRPILCLGPKGCDMDEILKYTGAGKCLENENSKEIRNFIASCYKNFRVGFNIIASDKIEEYSCRNQVKRLSQLFNRVINH